jgi:ankyrin repeat protein
MENDALTEAIKNDYFVDYISLVGDIKDINAQDSDGITPLIAAIIYDRFIMFVGLLNFHNADVNAADKDGRTPLYYTVKYKRFSMRLSIESSDGY